MIAVLKPKYLDFVGKLISGDFVLIAELIARALHDKSWCFYPGKMSGTMLCRFSDWMKWISKTQESRDFTGRVKFICNHTGNATTHGLATYEYGPSCAQCFQRSQIFRNKTFGAGRWFSPGGCPPACHVTEFETCNPKTGQRE